LLEAAARRAASSSFCSSKRASASRSCARWARPRPGSAAPAAPSCRAGRKPRADAPGRAAAAPRRTRPGLVWAASEAAARAAGRRSAWCASVGPRSRQHLLRPRAQTVLVVDESSRARGPLVVLPLVHALQGLVESGDDVLLRGLRGRSASTRVRAGLARQAMRLGRILLSCSATAVMSAAAPPGPAARTCSRVFRRQRATRPRRTWSAGAALSPRAARVHRARARAGVDGWSASRRGCRWLAGCSARREVTWFWATTAASRSGRRRPAACRPCRPQFRGRLLALADGLEGLLQPQLAVGEHALDLRVVHDVEAPAVRDGRLRGPAGRGCPPRAAHG
jgi:hypothetical protein